jgi:hypothetical protein
MPEDETSATDEARRKALLKLPMPEDKTAATHEARKKALTAYYRKEQKEEEEKNLTNTMANV